MKDIAKTISKSGLGIITSLSAANVSKLARNIGQTAEAVCSIVSVIIAAITVVYVYYKMRNERREFKENENN